ncbi:MAG: lysophospholipid acyltransferase family protein, partial [Gemmatimonadetes bacterium]|nr:lysophospholipid acyltransferase family protein [Gemmatimonadota bacterium]
MSARRPTQRHRLEHLLLATGAAAAGVVGGRGADLLGSALGRLTYRTLRLRRREVEENLRRAFPAQDQAWVRATAAAAYAHLGRELLALLGLASSGREEILARTEALGLYSFREALRRGQGAVVVSGHFGNWEIAAASLTARGIPLDVVVQPLANPLVDRAVRRARERLGMHVIERAHAARQGLAALRAGRVVALVADQDARRAGVLVPFFGRPASTHRGPAVLAL